METEEYILALAVAICTVSVVRGLKKDFDARRRQSRIAKILYKTNKRTMKDFEKSMAAYEQTQQRVWNGFEYSNN